MKFVNSMVDILIHKNRQFRPGQNHLFSRGIKLIFIIKRLNENVYFLFDVHWRKKMKRSMVKVLSFFVAASLTLGVYFPVPYAAAAAAEGEGFSVNAAESGTADLKPTGPAAGELAGEAGEEPAALPTTEPTALPGEGQPADPPAAPSAAPTQEPGEAAGAEPGETPEAGAEPTAAPGEPPLPSMSAGEEMGRARYTAEQNNGGPGQGVMVCRVTDNNGKSDEYGTLQEGISAAASGDTVTLLSNVEIAATLTLEKGLVLDGAGKTATVTDTAKATCAFKVSTAEAVTLKNLTLIGAKNGVKLANAAANLTLAGCVFSVSMYGVDGQLDNSGKYSGMSLVLDHTQLKDSAVADFETDAHIITSSRGIQLYNAQNSTVELRNGSSLNGFGYCINVSGTMRNDGVIDTSGLVITIDHSQLRGWTSFNVWGSNGIYTLRDSRVLGINVSSAASNNFSAIVFNKDPETPARDNTLNIENSTITNYQAGSCREELLRIACEINKLNLSGAVNFVDTTGNITSALFLDEMGDPVAFIQNNINIAPGAQVNCTSISEGQTRSIPLAPDYKIKKTCKDESGKPAVSYGTSFRAVVSRVDYEKAQENNETIILLKDIDASGFAVNSEHGHGNEYGGWTLDLAGCTLRVGQWDADKVKVIDTSVDHTGRLLAGGKSVLAARIGDVLYPTIAAALEKVKAGETIVVLPGTYGEKVLLHGRPENITLRAETLGQVVLTGGVAGGDAGNLFPAAFTVENLVFQNCGLNLGNTFKENSACDVKIQNNRFLYTDPAQVSVGININVNAKVNNRSGTFTIQNNEFDYSALAAEQAKGYAAVNCSEIGAKMVITKNVIRGAGRGIQATMLGTETVAEVTDNTLENIVLRGIQLAGQNSAQNQGTGSATVTGNLLKNCGTGLRLHENYNVVGSVGTLTFEKNRFVGCAEDLWNLSPKTELDGSGNYYGGGLPKCNLSTDGALPNYKVKCESYYEDEAMKVLLAVSAAESQVDKDKVETPPLPAGAPAGTVITDENKKTAVEDLNNEIAANPHAASPAQGLAKAAHEQLSEGDQVYLKIGLNDVELRADYDAEQKQVVLTPAVLTFKVEPWVKPASGTEARLENNKLSGGAVTFRLPVPGAIALGSQTKVEHLRADGTVADIQWPFVQQQEGEKFVRVSAAHFSDFVVTFNAYKPPENQSGGSGEQPAATPVPYNWYGVLAQLQALGDKGSLTVDVARELAVPQYIWQQIFGKDVTVVFKRGLDSFRFNGLQLKEAGFDPDNGHNLNDLAAYTTETLGAKKAEAPTEAPAEQPETTAEPEPTQAPKPTTEAPRPSETPQAAPSATPAPTAAQGARPGVWLWVTIGAAALLLILVAALAAVRRRR